jgi:hypothetical protein
LEEMVTISGGEPPHKKLVPLWEAQLTQITTDTTPSLVEVTTITHGDNQELKVDSLVVEIMTTHGDNKELKLQLWDYILQVNGMEEVVHRLSQN